jgi:hypothetical protein
MKLCYNFSFSNSKEVYLIKVLVKNHTHLHNMFWVKNHHVKIQEDSSHYFPLCTVQTCCSTLAELQLQLSYYNGTHMVMFHNIRASVYTMHVN